MCLVAMTALCFHRAWLMPPGSMLTCCSPSQSLQLAVSQAAVHGLSLITLGTTHASCTCTDTLRAPLNPCRRPRPRT